VDVRKEDHKIGVTPTLVRRAAAFATRGIGVYPFNHPHFDEVRVTKLYDIKENPLNLGEWGFGITVSFLLEGKRLRWVEFGCRLTGAGGAPIVQEVK